LALRSVKSSPGHQSGCGLRLAQHPNPSRLLAAAIISELPKEGVDENKQ